MATLVQNGLRQIPQCQCGNSTLCISEVGFHGESHESRSSKRDFPGGAVDTNLPASAGDKGSIAGSGRSHMLLGH